jgi:5-formyltetrahydrofolate cyclo-ligase
MQPAKRHPVVQPDLVLVPLIAIDRHGTRLGRGKGHYDRALTRLKKNGAKLIGIGWQLQRLVETIPADEWDVPLDGFASPDGLELFDNHRE